MKENMPPLLSALEATSRLGVSRATLYSYVSRGLVRAVAAPDDARRSGYDARDVAALIEKRGRGRGRREIASSTTHWGEPILRSALTRIADGAFFYRDEDAVALAGHAPLEDVAALLWKVSPTVLPDMAEALPPQAGMLERCLLAVAGEAGRSDWSMHPPQIAAAATRLLAIVAQAAAGRRLASGRAVHEQIGAAWGLDETGADLVRRALVLCADHELNASAYAARVVASTGASLAAAVLAGLAALSGPLHGGMTGRVRMMMADPEMARDPMTCLSARLARGEALPGFGHRLYPAGDPRAAALLAAYPPPPDWRAMIDAAMALTGLHPTIDVALAMLEQSLPLPAGGGFALFAAGRTVGWIAHALEQRADGRLIRPRAEYVAA